MSHESDPDYPRASQMLCAHDIESSRNRQFDIALDTPRGPDLDADLPTTSRAERYKQSARTSGGAEKWLDVRLFRSPTDAVMSAKRAGYQARCRS